MKVCGIILVPIEPHSPFRSMIFEIKNKTFKVPKFTLVIFSIFVFLGAFFALSVKDAAAAFDPLKCPSRTTGSRLLYECPDINVSLNPASPKLNDSVTVNVSINNSEAAALYADKGFDVVMYKCEAGWLGNSCSTVIKKWETAPGNGTAFIFSGFKVVSPFAVGLNKIRFSVKAEATSADAIEGGSSEVYFIKDIDVTVGPSASVTQPTINFNTSKTYNSGRVLVRVDFTYTPDTAQNAATAFQYTCFPGDSQKSLSKDAAYFSCDYPADVKDYVAVITALSGTRQITTANINVNIDGKEKDSGTITVGSDPTGKNSEGGIWGLVNKIIGAILQLVSEVVYFIFYWFIAPLIQALLSIRTYTDTFVNVIYPGWEIIRNICNLAFIAVLIAIGLATLFRVESYKFRHLLVQLILAALLVNFSLVIAQAILGLADTIQSQFLPNNVEVIRSLARDLMVTNIRTAVWDLPVGQQSGLSNTATMFFYASMTVGSFLVFAAIAIFLLIRIVALWLLLMVSPVAYVAGVLPSTANLRGQWWSLFIKYAFFTPLMAFFLNLTAVISAQTREQSLLQTVTSAQLGDSDFAVFVFKTASNVILLVFLLASLKVAEEFGIMGASAITEIAKKGLYVPFAAPAGVAKYGAEVGWGYLMRKKTEKSIPLSKKGWLGKAAFAALNPSILKHALDKRKERREGLISHVAEGAMAAEVVGKFPLTKETLPDLASEALEHGAMERLKDRPYIGERQTYQRLKTLMNDGTKDLNAIRDVWTDIMALASGKGTNYILSLSKDLGLGQNFDASDKGLIQFANAMHKHGYGSKEQIAHMMTQLNNYYYKNGEYGFAEMVGTHDGHPSIIETYDGTEKGVDPSLEGEIKGSPAYLLLNEEIKEEMHNDSVNFMQAEAASGRSITIEQAKAEIEKNADSYLQRAYNRHSAELGNANMGAYHGFDDEHFKHDYDNAKTFYNAQEEAQINKNKLENQQAARDVHWSARANVQKDGTYKLTYGGVADIIDRGSGYYAQFSRQQPKVVKAMLKAVERDEAVEVNPPEYGGVRMNMAVKQVADRAYKEIMDNEMEAGLEITEAKKEEMRKMALAVAEVKHRLYKTYALEGKNYKNGDEWEHFKVELGNLDSTFEDYKAAMPGGFYEKDDDMDLAKAFNFSKKETKASAPTP